MTEFSKKSILLVLTEASVVGICLVLLVNILMYFKDKIPDLLGQKDRIEIYFIAGFLFHIIFEWTGINLWYSKEYCKML